MEEVISTPELDCPDLATAGEVNTTTSAGAEGLMRRFRSAALWAVGGAVIARTLNMAAWLVCARVLGKDAFGHLSVVQSTTGALGVLSGMGLGLTATKYTAELRDCDPCRAGRILALGQAVALVAGTMLAGGLVLGARLLAARTLGDVALTTPLRIGSGLVLFGAVSGFQTGALMGLEAFRALARLGLWIGLISLPLIAGGSRFGGVDGAVGGFVIALGTGAVLGQIALRRECRRAGIEVKFAGCQAEVPLLFIFSLPALMASALVSPAMWLCDTWLVHQRDGFSQLGLYGAADRWRLAILFVPSSLTGPVMSLLSHLRGRRDRKGFREIFRINMAVTVGSVALLALIAGTMAAKLMRLFGSGYQQGTVLLSILAFSAVPEATNTFLGQRVVTRSMWTRFGFDVILVSTLLITGYLLIPRWRSIGLALAYALAFTVTSFCLLIFDWKHEAES